MCRPLFAADSPIHNPYYVPVEVHWCHSGKVILKLMKSEHIKSDSDHFCCNFTPQKFSFDLSHLCIRRKLFESCALLYCENRNGLSFCSLLEFNVPLLWYLGILLSAGWIQPTLPYAIWKPVS